MIPQDFISEKEGDYAKWKINIIEEDLHKLGTDVFNRNITAREIRIRLIDAQDRINTLLKDAEDF